MAARRVLLVAALLCTMAASPAFANGAAARPTFRTGGLFRRLLVTAKVAARRLWRVGSSGSGAVAASATAPVQPSYPGICNVTYDSQAGFSAEIAFAQANGRCVGAFSQCLLTPSNLTCLGTCTAQIDVLQAQCDTTYCEFSGSLSNPANGNIPPFNFRSAGCYPDACDQTQHDALQAVWRYEACGPTYWQAADCGALTLDCAYDLSPTTIWIIVGGTVGGFLGLVLLIAVAWWCCSKRTPDEADEEDADGGQYYGGVVGYDGGHGDELPGAGTADTHSLLPRGGSGAAAPSEGHAFSAGGSGGAFTFAVRGSPATRGAAAGGSSGEADVHGGSGETQRRILDEGEDRL